MAKNGERRGLRVLKADEKPETPAEPKEGDPKEVFLKSIAEQAALYDGIVVIFTKGEQIGDIRSFKDEFFHTQGVLDMAADSYPMIRAPLMFDEDDE